MQTRGRWDACSSVRAGGPGTRHLLSRSIVIAWAPEDRPTARRTRARCRSVRYAVQSLAAVCSRVDEVLDVAGDLSAFDLFESAGDSLLEGRLLHTGGDAGPR